MQTSKYPTTIDLKSLQSEGEKYQFSRATGELNNKLSDLIAEQNYQANLLLKPAGNAYTISGQINTQLNLICSHCGREMDFPVNDQFEELIMVDSERPRAGHSGHTGMNADSQIFCNYQNTYQFDLAEFIHEHIAAAEPFAPRCERADCETYFDNTISSVELDKSANPFAVLKNLNLSNQRD